MRLVQITHASSSRPMHATGDRECWPINRAVAAPAVLLPVSHLWVELQPISQNVAKSKRLALELVEVQSPVGDNHPLAVLRELAVIIELKDFDCRKPSGKVLVKP